MSELIRERAGGRAAENFYALGLAHLEGKEKFREEFDRAFPPENEEPSPSTAPAKP
jgi:hypothetical protein